MKKVIVLLWAVILCCTLAAGCSKKNTLADGTYTADFNTDSSMFHVNEAYDGKGILTVEKGQMTIHVSMPSKNIVNLLSGKCRRCTEGWRRADPACDRYSNLF